MEYIFKGAHNILSSRNGEIVEIGGEYFEMVVCTQEKTVVNKWDNERERWQLFIDIMTLKSVYDHDEKWNS